MLRSQSAVIGPSSSALRFGVSARSLPCDLERHMLSYLDVMWLASVDVCSRGLDAAILRYVKSAADLTFDEPPTADKGFTALWHRALHLVCDCTQSLR